MLGENENSYVRSYIGTQSTGIAYETLLTLQVLSVQPLRAKTMAMQDCQSATMGNIMTHLLENQNGMPSIDCFGLMGI